MPRSLSSHTRQCRTDRRRGQPCARGHRNGIRERHRIFPVHTEHQIASGNEEAVRNEAEQRHREIMQSTIQALGSQCRVAIDQMKEVCDKQVLSMQDRINLLERQLAESQAKVASADSLHCLLYTSPSPRDA